MVARVVWGALADYCGRPRLVLAGIAAVDAACMLLLGYVGSDWPYWAMYGLCVTIGACAVGWSGVLLAEAASLGCAAVAARLAAARGVWSSEAACTTLSGGGRRCE